MRRSFSPFRSAALRRARARASAFTLIEIVSVMAILAVMVSLGGIPLLGVLGGSGVTSRAATSISTRLELARSYAMANNTYVWVGFFNDTARQRLSIAVVAGNSGTSGDIASPANYTLIGRVETHSQTSLQVAGAASATVDDVSKSAYLPFTVTIGGTPVTFSNVIQFSPAGQASIDPALVSHLVQLGLQPAARVARTGDVALVQVAGLSGNVRVQLP